MAYSGGPLIVAAIDFGTTYSGYAFSTYNDFERDPLNISTCSWPNAYGQSPKNSTSVLFDDEGNFHSFGYPAEKKYAQLALVGNHKKWKFFKRFKMELYRTQKLNRHLTITDDNGNKMSAMDVIAAVIRYLKEHAKKTCFAAVTNLEESDILWVLTVPAIWSDDAKQFMREAAKKAGIQRERLLIVLESEVASIYEKQNALQKSGDGSLQRLPPGTRYLVLDAGGGTVDISIQEVQENDKLKSISCACGGDWGGTKVDEAFFGFLAEIIGKPALQDFISCHNLEFLELSQDLEMKKRGVEYKESDSSVFFTIPYSMNECCKKFNDGRTIANVIESSDEFNTRVSVVAGNKLKVDDALAKSWFRGSVTRITEQLEEIIRNPNMKGIKAILMVGGFSESELLKEAIVNITQVKENQIDIIRPKDASLAVLKGAVMYGHKPIIQSRILRYTYGVDTTVLYKEGVHKRSKQYKTKSGEVRCKDIFDIHAVKGNTVVIGEPQKKMTYEISEADSTGMDFPVFRSTESDPLYVTDPSCERIGTLSVEMPDISRGLNRSVELKITFWDTELKVTAIDPESKESFEAAIDCLE
ncbi:heat shock 70 kDa protein 12A-like [Argopecten irradians]|uniref:heat shock 70 kDa protein 12A-like n=1 Tax=Argopecten irradians TaxID=31199 RepID=UPI0037222E18